MHHGASGKPYCTLRRKWEWTHKQYLTPKTLLIIRDSLKGVSGHSGVPRSPLEICWPAQFSPRAGEWQWGLGHKGQKWPLWKAPFWFQSSKASFGTRAEEMGAKVIVRQTYIPFLWTGFLSGAWGEVTHLGWWVKGCGRSEQREDMNWLSQWVEN